MQLATLPILVKSQATETDKSKYRKPLHPRVFRKSYLFEPVSKPQGDLTEIKKDVFINSDVKDVKGSSLQRKTSERPARSFTPTSLGEYQKYLESENDREAMPEPVPEDQPDQDKSKLHNLKDGKKKDKSRSSSNKKWIKKNKGFNSVLRTDKHKKKTPLQESLGPVSSPEGEDSELEDDREYTEAIKFEHIRNSEDAFPISKPMGDDDLKIDIENTEKDIYSNITSSKQERLFWIIFLSVQFILLTILCRMCFSCLTVIMHAYCKDFSNFNKNSSKGNSYSLVGNKSNNTISSTCNSKCQNDEEILSSEGCYLGRLGTKGKLGASYY